MAQLRLGTTIGGYAAYHAGNLPVYGTRWPSAAEAGALAITGGTTTGSIRAPYLQAGLPANAWKAMMGASGTENEGIFGVSSDGTGAWHSYIRIGRTLFQYNNGVGNYNVYHSGTTIPWDKVSGGSTGLIAGAGSQGASYGSLTVSGSKGAYAGIYFSDYDMHMMVHGTVQGFKTTSSWQWYFQDGVLTVGSVPWARLTGVPSTFTPNAHTHDDRYFTEAEADGRFLGKTATATNSTNLNGVAATGYARAYSGSYTFGGNSNAITTAQFLDLLAAHGAFASPVWVARGSWNYAGNQVISDTGVGNIHLAGAVIEVVGTSSGNCTIRIHQPTTTSSGTPGGDYIYVNNGPTYNPGWRKLYNTMHPPSYLDVGALAAGGTAVNSSKLGGYAQSTSWVANTIALRNASADIEARLFKSNYANQDTITGAMAFRVNNSSDTYIRFCSSPAAVRAWLGAQVAGSYAAASHTHAGTDVTVLGNRISVGSAGELYANNTSYRQAGMYGTYDAAKVGHIWSMGTSYKVNAAGTNFGNLYGLAYKYVSNPHRWDNGRRSPGSMVSERRT